MSLRNCAELDDTETNLSRTCHLHAIVLPPDLRHTFHRSETTAFIEKSLKNDLKNRL